MSNRKDKRERIIMKTAYIYPGQGSQYVGMAYKIYERYAECKMIVEQASDILSLDMKKIMFEENDLINQTEYTQIAILTASRCMEKASVLNGYAQPDIVAGLSLGEYNALVTADAISFEDALKLVRIRGKLMQYAVPVGKGSMAAIIRVPEERIENVCKAVSESEGLSVQISNYNCPGQYVIAGDYMAVDKACQILKPEARAVTKLNVSVPSHCKLMHPIVEEFRSEIAKIVFNDLKIPYVSNVTGNIVDDRTQVPDLLVKQLYSPVLWYQSINTMIRVGVEEFLETGPGKVLTSYIPRISKEVRGTSLDKALQE